MNKAFVTREVEALRPAIVAIVAELLLRTFPGLQPAVPLTELVWQPGAVVRTLTALPVTW